MTTQTEQVEATKFCHKCSTFKPLDLFGKNRSTKDGRQTCCKSCQSIVNKNFRLKNADRLEQYRSKFYSENAQHLAIKSRLRAIEYRKKRNLDPVKKARLAEQQRISARKHYLKFPAKIAARKAVIRAIELGLILRPVACSVCENYGKVEAHHDSYERERWLDVRWLCRKCHMEHHRKYPDQPA
jgi:hypothetical protein